MSGNIDALHALGQSLWYDNIQRGLLESGALASMIEHGDIRGVTSNPSIFNHAIGKSTDYDSALVPMAWAGWKAEDIFYQLASEDIRAAADLFRPLYESSNKGDGYVSLEVSPFLAESTEGTIEEARRIWKTVDRPNLMVKIPATKPGIPAIEQAIAAGLNINVTLIFSLERYTAVMEAYMRGLEQRLRDGHPIDGIASVASFFVSRVDTKIDPRLQEIMRQEGPQSQEAAQLMGKAAIANAKLAYELFRETFGGKRFKRLAEHGARLQRPLWASTSTKNPAYPDVMYVEELIGPDTVDTVPPQTLDAFRDHGRARVTITEQVDEARQHITRLNALGITMDQVTQELEEEGVKAFTDAFEALLHTIETRRAQAIMELGPLQADAVECVNQLEVDRAAVRLHEGDPTLWTQDPAGQAEVRGRLDWLNAPQTSQALAREVEEFALKVVAEGYSHALVLGMGGSSLAPEVFSLIGAAAVTRDARPGLKLAILDSTDPEQVAAALRANPPAKTLYIVSSKSGTTTEPNTFMEFFWARAAEKLGEKTGEHFVAITDPGSSLEKVAQEKGFRKVFEADPNVGGRYSALIAFGLVPAGLAGLDLGRLLGCAEWMARQCAADVPPGRNPGLVLGAVIGLAARHGRDKLTILTDRQWTPFGAWLEQLVAESSGKQGKGILPVADEPAGLPNVYASDRIFVYLRSTGELDERVNRLQKAGFPALTFPVGDAYDLGAEMYRWEVAIAVACAVIGVNAFDQPDVQENKTRTAQMVEAYQKSGKLDSDPPIKEVPEALIYGESFPGLVDAHSLKEVVEAFLRQREAGDYIAINAYIPRTVLNEVRLRVVRTALRRATKLATTVGFGPRFLHSTGQMHKGGPNTGLFLELTHPVQHNLEIPGAGLSFGTLERAQALGDFEVLRAHGRRVVRIELKSGNPRKLI
jgi:transaldolase/glucose-6-phosphate isomerase